MLFARKNCVLKELKSKKNKEKKAPAPRCRFAFRLHKKALLCNGKPTPFFFKEILQSFVWRLPK